MIIKEGASKSARPKSSLGRLQADVKRGFDKKVDEIRMTNPAKNSVSRIISL